MLFFGSIILIQYFPIYSPGDDVFQAICNLLCYKHIDINYQMSSCDTSLRSYVPLALYLIVAAVFDFSHKMCSSRS